MAKRELVQCDHCSSVEQIERVRIVIGQGEGAVDMWADWCPEQIAVLRAVMKKGGMRRRGQRRRLPPIDPNKLVAERRRVTPT